MAQNIKTIQGITLANTKTCQGIAIANIKTIQGIDNTSGGSGAAFSDDFNRANGALGANWSAYAGAADINTNTWRMNTASFGQVCTGYVGTSCNTVNQYAKITFGADAQYPSVYFRLTDGSSASYEILFDGNNGDAFWYHHATPGASGTQIGATVNLGQALNNDTIGITITGTGANTDIRMWINPTNLPTSASNWDGDTTPDGTWLTTDPGANAVDTGNQVGIGGQEGAANTVRLENFFGGDIP